MKKGELIAAIIGQLSEYDDKEEIYHSVASSRLNERYDILPISDVLVLPDENGRINLIIG